jgi:hypothetical protein
MSFSSYRELGFNCILLVEGPHDVKTVQQFLRQLKKEHEIVVLPLGGGSMINKGVADQLLEIKRISPNISAIVDSEKDKSDALLEVPRVGFQQACRDAEVHCLVLERRAIENYLTEEAVKAEKGEKYRALAPYERLADVQPAWGKHENWRIARRMEFAEIADTDLGLFLASL